MFLHDKCRKCRLTEENSMFEFTITPVLLIAHCNVLHQYLRIKKDRRIALTQVR